MSTIYDVIVIGTGPGGYHAAIRAAQLGKKVLAVEAEYVGGVCLNVGCIPTKALLHAAEEFEGVKHGASFGLEVKDARMDLKKLGSWRDGIVKRLTGGVSQLFKGNKVELKTGFAKFVGPKTIEVGGERIEGKTFIIATGSEPNTLPGFEVDQKEIIDSTGALRVEDNFPKRLLCIGGGAIGLEFAQVYKRMGAEVTVIEFMGQILPAADPETAGLLAKVLTKQGIAIKTHTKGVNVERKKDGLHVTLEDVKSGAQEEIVVDKILVATGRRPRGKGLGLEAIGVRVDERGFIPTNERMETGVPGIYAIGDVTRPPLLAHKAMKEGLVAAENAAGGNAVMDYHIPNVVYTSPEWAAVGLTEEEAAKAGYKVKVGKFPLSASGRAMTLEATDGLIKLVGDAETDLLLGVHILGPNASDMIGEAALALEMGATVTDVALTVHAHPTLSEGIMEAAEHLHKQAIHIANR
ncbi:MULTISPECIES: dihydrolipoyl dehydrogenase [unclassified Meiothermus]|uniref:dihydrolipoyl dehydrogenase n=1 Tax=unclassified Meiothermus TaxID=370471 RepID=UPI000D7B9AF3|nr:MULTISPECIES: dihydrolipoyl dehydrogenase [unclassified Meiothermus]PZA08587.1 dihydrolipoyl dehydrogenase [Meiothermus sp. Pnk-1]RYM40796.1 dihydrolipoyl dehydrogenase [Meiothermus sp. PNK-Is4]